MSPDEDSQCIWKGGQKNRRLALFSTFGRIFKKLIWPQAGTRQSKNKKLQNEPILDFCGVLYVNGLGRKTVILSQKMNPK
jgi:hypothetical protein